MSEGERDWPPKNPDEFIRSEEFGTRMLKLVEWLTKRYRDRDFSDGIASTFTWLVDRVDEDKSFFSTSRFKKESDFWAYLRQAVWNASRLAARKRKREKSIESLPTSSELASTDMSPDLAASFIECMGKLSELQRRVYETMLYEDGPTIDDRLAYVTSVAQSSEPSATEKDVEVVFREACTALYECIYGKDGA